MRACWVFMIFVGYRLSHAAQPQSTCACNEQLKTFYVPTGDSVTVPCPELAIKDKDVTFNLFKDQELISNYTCNFENNKSNCKPLYTGGEVQLQDKGNKSVIFRLTVVNSSHRGIYTCEGKVTFPPPLTTKPSTSRIRVLVEGHQCKSEGKNPATGGDQNCGFHWIWILVILLSVYSVTVTTIALVNWVKLRRTDNQSDYMNTKPRVPRDCKKKRGVQNPILPRHF